MNLYLRDKEKYQQGIEQGIEQGIKTERELAKKQTLKTARSLIGFLSPDIIVSKFDITMEELMKKQPDDDGPKA